MALSARAHQLCEPDPKYHFWEILQNLWDPQTNPEGFVSLGVAENVLMHGVLSEHIHANIALANDDFTYGDGRKRLKAVLAQFLNKHFNPAHKVEPAHLSISNGCSSALEHVAWAFGNPGDVFLLGRPYYGTFVPDVTLRMGTQLAMVDFYGADPLGLDGVQMYEQVVRDVQAQGRRVAGLILAHPHNPLGRCYSRAVIVALMRLCEKYQIHLISDEIYALSTFANRIDQREDQTPFESALSINTDGLVNPALIHVIWGVSKDFGANGLRLGAIISQHNSALHRALVPPSLYSSSSSITDHVVANLLEDEEWIEAYLRKNRRKLAENHEHVVKWAEQHDIEHTRGVNAAFFLWVNLGAAYKRNHENMPAGGNVDGAVNDALLRRRVFLASGLHFGAEEAGWFRIVFTQTRDYLDEGLRRIVVALGTSE